MMPEIDRAALTAVPMFPLPDVVLLPGALLPLHVFEPRYRDLMRDVLAGAGLIAIARLQPGYEADYHGAPAVFATLGVGEVIASQELTDGRYNVIVRGRIRAHLTEELMSEPGRSYRTIRAAPLEDFTPSSPGVLDAAHRAFIDRCDQLADVLDDNGDKLRELVRAESEPGVCADMMGAALVNDVDELQALLENREADDRLSFLIRHVSRMVREQGGSPVTN